MTAASGVLEKILADKRARLARGEYAVPPGADHASKPDGARFTASLRAPGVRIIAEIKGRSPSAGEILPGADGKVETMALAYRRGHAAAISVVVEEDHFGGKPDWLPRAKKISGLPALWKDFIVSDSQIAFAAANGADAILLIVRALGESDMAALAASAKSQGLAVVAEAHGEEEISRAAAISPDVLGINARDLGTFATNLEALEAIAPRLPAGPVRLAESGIRSPEDIRRLRGAGYEAFLIGETLLRSDDPEDTLRELRA